MILLLSALALASDCASCHQRAHDAWTASRHAQAFSNPAFQAAWSRYPDRWCLDCHAPSPAQREALKPGADALPAGTLVSHADRSAPIGGVDCEACHLRDGVVRAPSRPGLRARAAHKITYDRELGTEGCAACHQFSAPGGAPVQTTADEHAAWGGKASCAECHDAHVLPGSRDQERVRAAITAQVGCEEGGLIATIDGHGLGHRFPTGDPYRRLVLEVGTDRGLTGQWVIGRTVTGMGASFHETSDHRLPLPDPQGESHLALALGDREASWWRLSYLMTEPSHHELTGLEPGWVVWEGAIEPGGCRR